MKISAIALTPWYMVMAAILCPVKSHLLRKAEPQQSEEINRKLQVATGAIRINAGAQEAFIDEEGNEWEVDRYFTGGTTYGGPNIPHYYAFQGPEYYANWSRLASEAVARCKKSLYCYERFGSFDYSIPVEPGPYSVELYFTENAPFDAGWRRFDVYLEGKLVEHNLTVSKEPLVLSYQIPILDGEATISFGFIRDNPKINAIAIIPFTGSTPRPTSAPTAAPTPSAAPTPTPPFAININSGASERNYVDSTGITWSFDARGSDFARYLTGAGVYSYGVFAGRFDSGTEDYYFSERYAWGKWGYSIPVDERGMYEVTLHFAELYYTEPGQREFAVVIEDVYQEERMDIVERAGGNFIGIALSYIVPVTDGFVSIDFVPIKENPKVNSVSVRLHSGSIPPTPSPAPTPSSAPTPTPPFEININSGAPNRNYVDSNGITWSHDANGSDFARYLTGASVFSYGVVGGRFNSGTEDYYFSERHAYGKWGYSIPVDERGMYEVTLHFAEIYYTEPGQREFAVVIEDVYEEERMDIVERAGGNFIGIALSYIVPVTDGFVSIDFVPIKENPKVNSVSVRLHSGSIPPTVSPPTLSPVHVEPPTQSACVSSSGGCATAAVELQEKINMASSGETIAICNEATIQTPTALLSTEEKELTLCCSGGSRCTMQSTGTDSNLRVSGGSLNIAGITFVGGKTNRSGGNVQIASDGDHTITGCHFVDGQSASDGANLYVKGKTVTIENSSFSGGLSTNGNGGGVYATGTNTVEILRSTFHDNQAHFGGGAVVRGSDGVTVSSSTFSSNQAGGAGGLSLHVLANATMKVEDCSFTSNSAIDSGFGGGFTITAQEHPVNISLQRNEFNLNMAGSGGIGNIVGFRNAPSIIASENNAAGNNATECDGIFINLGRICAAPNDL